MKRHLSSIILCLISLGCIASAADRPYLYKVTLVQAAPRKLLELIDLYKQRSSALKAVDEAPLWMRHSQGDDWDIMSLLPMGSYNEYFEPQRPAKRNSLTGGLAETLKEDMTC